MAINLIVKLFTLTLEQKGKAWRLVSTKNDSELCTQLLWSVLIYYSCGNIVITTKVDERQTESNFPILAYSMNVMIAYYIQEGQ